MLSTLVKIGLIGVMFAAPVVARAEDITPGKYFCFVTHMAGIQFENDGRITSGNLKPTAEKFFLTIAPVEPLAECPTTRMAGLNYWFFCLSKFGAQIEDRLTLRGDDLHTFRGLLWGEDLLISSDLTFLSITNNLPGNYVSDGKCTRI